MIEISPRAKAILGYLDNRYASQTYKRFYGKSPYRNWQIQLRRIIYSLEQTPNKFGTELRFPTDWGEISYTRLKVNNIIMVVIDNFHFNYTDLHNWFTSAVYPTNGTVSNLKSLNVTSIYFVRPYRYLTLPNGERIYAIQSDTHLYSLADKGKQQVIKYWFSSLTFPIEEKIGELNIIGYGTINNIPYYIDDTLQLHHGAEIASMQRKTESKNRNHVIRLTEIEFKQMLLECITKIIKEIA